MSPNSTFDTDAMNNYLNTVAEMRRLTEAGATHGELLVAKMYMSIALADLIAPTETDEYRAYLVLIFMRDNNHSIYADIPPLEDVDTMPGTPPLVEEESADPAEIQNYQQDLLAWEAGEIDDYGNEINDEMPALE